MRAGPDIDYLARAGILGFQGPADGAPQLPGFQLADVSGGLWCVIGILAALAERQKTGQGQVLDVSMTEAAMPFGIVSLAGLFAGEAQKRGDGVLTGGIAAYNVYATKDGKHMALGALEPKFWLTFAAAVGLPRDAMGIAPGDHQRDLKKKVQEIFASRTRTEWEAFAKEHDCCLEPVLEPGELQGDPQHTERGMFFGKNLKLPLCEAAVRLEPPRAGEHTDAILREGGLDEAAIAALRQSGAIR
jgi:crotonobetainyl-CoA:carnitine CoA-transferase CaiB-like acyl-CoA transferase